MTTVPALLAEAAERWSGSTAVVDRRGSLTHGQLRDDVLGAAGALQALGVTAGDRVAGSLPNGREVVIGLLATMQLGAIWVGVNRTAAPAEREHLLAHSGARCLLVADGDAAPGPAPVVVADAAGEWRRGGGLAAGLGAAPAAGDPAAIAYTSGTSGFPKGVVHSHHNLVLAARVAAADQGGPPVIGVCLPLTILNMAVLGPLQALVAGGTVVCLDRTDPASLAAAVEDHRLARMSMPPTLAYDLVVSEEVRPEQLRTLVDLGVGGANRPPGLAERWAERFGHPLRVGYGLTEAPTSVCRTPAGTAPVPGSAGRALPHVRVDVRGAAGDIVPAGEQGELCVGPADDGPWRGCYTPMLGYWSDPAATADALRDGVLHTGDVGWIDDAGNVFVVGRSGDVIVRGGANIDPVEIERVVAEDPSVEACAVVGRPHPRLGEEVVAFVQPVRGARPSPAGVQDRCRGQLARYKVPVEVFLVDELPRNAMGKVAKAELRRRLG